MAKPKHPQSRQAPAKTAPALRRRTYIREWRIAAGLTQEQCAEIVDKDRTTYSRTERGLIPYNQDFIELLSTAFRCSPSDLLSVNPASRPIELQLVENFRAAQPETQRIVKAALRIAEEQGQTPT